MTRSPDSRSDRSFIGFLSGLPRDMRMIWTGLAPRLKLSALLAGTTALILMALTLFGPSSARLGAAIGLVALLIVLQITVMGLLISGRLVSPTRPERQLAIDALGKLRAGDFAEAVEGYRSAITAGVPIGAIGALYALATYLNADQEGAAAILREAVRELPNDPARAWLIGALLMICLSPPPGTEIYATVLDIMQINQEGQIAWQTEAERFQSTSYGQHLTDLLMAAESQIASPESVHP